MPDADPFIVVTHKGAPKNASGPSNRGALVAQAWPVHPRTGREDRRELRFAANIACASARREPAALAVRRLSLSYRLQVVEAPFQRYSSGEPLLTDDRSLYPPISSPRPPRLTRRGCPLSELRDKLRRVGLRPTRQRVSLGWLLFGKGDRHITAEMLFDEATRARVPVSLATVYNTLHQFTEAGLLRQLAVDGAKAYFDTNPSEHHHFFLEDEGELVDMPASGISVAELPEPPAGMEMAGVEVIVRLRRKASKSPPECF